MHKEPKYIITVEVHSRRIAGDPLNTSLDRLLLVCGATLAHVAFRAA
jgi:hypothetical protein